MSNASGKKDISEEYESLRERVQQEIRDTDKNIAKLTKRKSELETLLKSPPQ